MPSHGSITKAGKVRSQTPKIEAKPRRSSVPRIRNRLNFEKRVIAVSQQAV
jgi:small subunit ribosomal protein S30e